MTEPEPESESGPQEIKDPEAYVNHRRLRSIFDIRDGMVEARRNVKLAPHDENFSLYEALSAYRALTDSYIVETEPLLRRYQGGIKLLEKADFGTIEVEPEVPNFGRGTNRHSVEPEVYEMKGLLSLVDSPDPLTAEYDVRRPSGRGKGRETGVTKRQVPFATLDNMVRSLNNFLAEVGFELDPQEDTEPGQIEDVGL
jgi:hypothetical protein